MPFQGHNFNLFLNLSYERGKKLLCVVMHFYKISKFLCKLQTSFQKIYLSGNGYLAAE